jgi:hypothetical protein
MQIIRLTVEQAKRASLSKTHCRITPTNPRTERANKLNPLNDTGASHPRVHLCEAWPCCRLSPFGRTRVGCTESICTFIPPLHTGNDPILFSSKPFVEVSPKRIFPLCGVTCRIWSILSCTCANFPSARRFGLPHNVLGPLSSSFV